MKLAYIQSDATGEVNRALTDAATRLMEQGVSVVGTIQTDTPRPKSDSCDMDVRVLPDGDVIRISQDLGPESRGCKLDPNALEQAVAQTMDRLDRAQLLVVNKFGKHEADGRGFREVIAEALARDIPVIVGTNGLNLQAFLDFCGGEATQVLATPDSIVDWARQG
ncbi:DUF2478 domain-containing protein [Thalassovita sp.]|uniref:DUF2478 domain-containing protein n=1 Tax=Thalassovita sp. TaxID=1979401 RepID=UPI0029DE5899|nr:DUF2478 domain-containing protein [Thalassovita sp.]